MVALNTTLDKLIVTRTDLGDASPVDIRVAFLRMLKDAGFENVTLSNVPPANLRTLWWHKDIKAFKRYDPITLTWALLAPGQWALHLLQMAAVAAGAETSLANNDLFLFFDVSRDEFRSMTAETLLALLSGEVPSAITSSPTEFIIDLTQLVPNVIYKFYGAIIWNTPGLTIDNITNADRVRMRVRTAADVSLTYAHNPAQHVGNSVQTVTDTYFAPPRVQNSHVPALATPSACPVEFSLIVHQAPRQVAMVFAATSVARNPGMVETAPGDAAAKIHFAIPAGVVMNGKILRP